MASATIYRQAQQGAPAVNPGRPVRAVFAGLWIGFWIAALVLSGYGIWFVNTHPGPDPWTHGPALGQSHSALDQWCFWFWVRFGPVALFILRIWKWILTIFLINLGLHHDIVGGMLIGLGVMKWNGKRGWRRYTEWLGAGPGAIPGSDRAALRIAFVCGIALYGFAISSAYPKPRGLSDYPAVPEPTPPTYSQNTSVIHSGSAVSTQLRTQRNADSTQTALTDSSYSQKVPVIHSGSAVSTQLRTQRNADSTQTEVRYAYPADEAIHQEPDGHWYPDETLSDINLRRQALKHRH